MKNVCEAPDKGLKLSFDFEPKIHHYRHCNFKDTSTYFYLLATLNKLKNRDWAPKLDYEKLIRSLLLYINDNLMSSETNYLKPYDATKDQTHFIMPRPAESIFDKAFFYSFLIDEKVQVK